MNNKIAILIKIILTILFIGCLFDMPYVYFQFVRIIGMTSFAVLAYFDHKRENKIWMIVWVCSALIINPIIKIPLGRMLWNVVDVIWVVLITISFLYKDEQSNKK
jgi:hypothetical protein